jgi:hypothetical protein
VDFGYVEQHRVQLHHIQAFSTMIGTRFFAFVAAASVVVALPNNATIVPRACGSYLSDSAIATAEAHFAANKVSAKADAGTFAAVIPVYWHVIQSGTAVTQGNIPDSQITSSITAMNTHYVRYVPR